MTTMMIQRPTMRQWNLSVAMILYTILCVMSRNNNIVLANELTYSYSPEALLDSYETVVSAMATNSTAPVHEDKIDGTGTSCTNTVGSNGNNSKDMVVSAIQLTAIGSPDNDMMGFWNRAVTAVREAALRGATLILLPELFMGPYFCQSQEASLMGLAQDLSDSYVVRGMPDLARELSVVLPVSVFERSGNALFNTVVMIDADGSILGTYREYSKKVLMVVVVVCLYGCIYVHGSIQVSMSTPT